MPTLEAKRDSAIANWPWREGNQFTLLEAPDQYFERLVQAIDDARSYILLEMYLVESGVLATRFIDAFLRARGRGVGVHLVLDGFGSLGLHKADRLRLTTAGADLRIYNIVHLRKRLHNFLRDHRKLMVVDGTVAFVGGIGLTDEFGVAGPNGTPWRDLVVEIHGPVVADWQETFLRTWRRAGGELKLSVLTVDPLPHGARGRVVLS